MPTEDENPNSPVARRMSMRRSRGGFASGSSTQSESLNARDGIVDEDDEDLENPEQLRDRIVSEARARSYPPPAVSTAPPGVPDPRQRLHDVARAGSAAFTKEYRHNLLHRLLLRRIPLDRIAQQMGVSISTIEKDRVELKARLRNVARELDINEIVGNQMELYAEMTGMALNIAGTAETPTAMKLAAIRTSLASEADRTRFLNTAGIFDVLRFRKAEDGSDVSDVQQLMQSTDAMFERLMAEEVVDAPKPARRVVRPAKANGFGKLTMDDPTASNSTDEEVEL